MRGHAYLAIWPQAGDRENIPFSIRYVPVQALNDLWGWGKVGQRLGVVEGRC